VRGFNPRLPGGRRRQTGDQRVTASGSFNPRLPGGRRQTQTVFDVVLARGFNPRLPGGRRLRIHQIPYTS